MVFSKIREAQEGPEKRLFGSIRAKLVLSFCSLFIVVLGTVELVSLWGLPFTQHSGRLRNRKTETFRGLNLVADLKKERLWQWIRERRDDAKILANNDLAMGLAVAILQKARELSSSGMEGAELRTSVRDDRDSVSLRNYLNLLKTSYVVYENIFIADALTGKVFASTDDAFMGADISKQPYFKDLLNSGSEAMGDMVVDSHSPDPHFHISRAINDTQGRPVAVLVMEVGAGDFIEPLLHTGGGLGVSGEAFLVNQDARILTSLKHALPDGTTAEPLKYQIKARLAVLAAHGGEGIIESKDYRGEPVLAAYRYLPITAEWGWGLVVKRDKAELFAPMRKELIYSFAILMVGLVSTVVFVVLLARGLTRPLMSLSKTASEVADGSLDARAVVTTRDEVGHLAHTFNEMLVCIQERTNELTNAKEKLELEITERKRAEEELKRHTAELEALNKELEAFTYSVSHDLRAPLRSVGGFAAILLEDYPDKLDAQGRDYLRRMCEASDRMGQMIDDLLNLSRVTRSDMRSDNVDLSKLAQSIAEELKKTQPQRRAEFSIEEGVIVKGDKRLLRMALENLLENAWKFTRKSPTARIELGLIQEDGQQVCFVRDNGAGFDMAYVDKLFGAFQRLHGMDDFEGTGIGLATVQRIIHRHGGRIWAEGAVGQGATFYFTLSLKKEKEHAGENHPSC